MKITIREDSLFYKLFFEYGVLEKYRIDNTCHLIRGFFLTLFLALLCLVVGLLGIAVLFMMAYLPYHFIGHAFGMEWKYLAEYPWLAKGGIHPFILLGGLGWAVALAVLWEKKIKPNRGESNFRRRWGEFEAYKKLHNKPHYYDFDQYQRDMRPKWIKSIAAFFHLICIDIEYRKTPEEKGEIPNHED